MESSGDSEIMENKGFSSAAAMAAGSCSTRGPIASVFDQVAGVAGFAASVRTVFTTSSTARTTTSGRSFWI